MQASSCVGLPDEAYLSPHTETELKLAVAPDHLDAVALSPVVIARRSGAPVQSRLRSTYFDTADRRLSGRKAVLRVRETPDGHIQTLKVGDGLTRHEWEVAVSGPALDLAAFTMAEAREELAGIAPDSLAPMFETRIERTIHWMDNGAIELAVDTGAIVRPDGGGEAISEIELELKSGEPVSLFRLAREIAATVPLRVEPRSKAARGFALANGESPRPVKAQRLALEPSTTVDSAMAAIFGACFTQFTVNVPCVLEGSDSEGVHQARVGLRRLRSALSLFKALVPITDQPWLRSETKWLAGALGPARDWDVFRAELLAPVKAAFAVYPELHADLAALDDAAAERRRHAYDSVREALASERHTAFHLRFGEWLESRGWRVQPVTPVSALLFQPLYATAESLLDRRHRKTRKIGRHFADLSHDDRHKLRISIKKLRYTVEFFRSLHDEKPVSQFVQQLGAFQDVLGHLNDVATAARLVPELGGDSPALSRAGGVVIGWHGRDLAALEPDLVEEWREFRAAKTFWEKPSRNTPTP